MPLLTFQKQFIGPVLVGLYGRPEVDVLLIDVLHHLWRHNPKLYWSTQFQSEWGNTVWPILSQTYHDATTPKRQSIRAFRKRPFRVGDTLHIYAFARQPHMTKLGEASVKEVHDIEILARPVTHSVYLDRRLIDDQELQKIALADGFASTFEMMYWFKNNHGPAFEGQLIKW